MGASRLTISFLQNRSMNESFGEAWRLRFGAEPPSDLTTLAPLLRHRSIRAYSDKPVEESVVRCLVGAAQSAATSSNLQLWSIISVHDPGRRAEIADLADNYDHIRRAPWYFAFLADHYRIKQAAAQVGEAAEGLDYAEFFIMAVIDAALAAERFACAAETLGLGICYIGAMRNNAPEIKRILDLPEGSFCTFGMCLGWPEENCAAKIKPRLSQEAIWFRERYGHAVDVKGYDRRMSDFYVSEQMKGEVTWSMRSGRRVDGHHLTGREILKAWLEREGFNRR